MTDDAIRVLVIDDDPDLRQVVCATLRADGFEALAAADGAQGLELAYTSHPHLILLDVMMPGMDGYQVCKELQFGYTKDIPVVFLTARNELVNMIEANRLGASAYVTKPFAAERLLTTVREVLRDASLYKDDVTGLPTLAGVQLELQRHLQDHRHLGLLYVAIDGVEGLERSHGFEAVDDLFRSVAQRISELPGSALREDDYLTCASLGDAFLVALAPPRHHEVLRDDELLRVKTRLQRELAIHLSHDLGDLELTPLEPYVGWSRLDLSPKVRFKRALLQAIALATTRLDQERSQARHRLGAELDRLLCGGQISCVYQPIVEVTGYGVLGYELLARGPQHSELHAAEALFEVARAERRLDELEMLCRAVATRGSAALPGTCLRFINAEPSTLFARSGEELWTADFLQLTPPELRPLTVVEVTEKNVVEDFALMRDVVKRLREYGFRVAVDDAGSGYSGLQTMVEIEPDFIKLDMSLTRGIADSLVRQKLVGTLSDFCRNADIGLVAEGVERRSQLEVLRGLGVPFAQGYLFGRPASPYPLRDNLPPGPDHIEPVVPGLPVDGAPA